MKRTISFICAVAMVLCCLVSTVNAQPASIDTTEIPELVFTELLPKPKTEVNLQKFEYIEVYNTTDKPLNLYDYCLTYNGSAANSWKFERSITEITPLRGGTDWLDKAGSSTANCTTTVENPADGTIAPKEVVILWSVTSDNYTNGAMTTTIADFKAAWGITSNVKIIAFDGNSNTDLGGAEKNFNVKDNGTGTYGIARYSDFLNAKANVDGCEFLCDAGDHDYSVNAYRYQDLDFMISWATIKFDGTAGDPVIGTTKAGADEDYGVNFVYVSTAGKRSVTFSYEKATPGTLTEAQAKYYSDKNFRGQPVSNVDEFIAMEAGKAYYLTADIDFGNVTTTNVVNGKQLNSILDGNNKTIYFNLTSGAKADGGMYNSIANNGAVIVKNLNIGSPEKKVTLEYTQSGNWSVNSVFAGQTNAAFSVIMENVNIYADLTVEGIKKCDVGGFIGKTNSQTDLYNCTFDGSITCGLTTTEDWRNNAAFIGNTVGDNNVIYGCINNGKIETREPKKDKNKDARAAGIVAYISKRVNIINCVNNGKIIAGAIDIGANKGKAGGIVSQNAGANSLIKGCTNNASISGSNEVGGIIGYSGVSTVITDYTITDKSLTSGRTDAGNVGKVAGLIEVPLMNVGAAIRLDTNGNTTGMRFSVKMEKNCYNSWKKDGGFIFKMLITPKKFVEATENKFTMADLDNLSVSSEKYLSVDMEKAYAEDDLYYYFYGSISEIMCGESGAKDHRDLEYCAIAVIGKGTNADDTKNTKKYSSTYVTRSVSDVAKAALADTSTTYTAAQRAVLAKYVVGE